MSFAGFKDTFCIVSHAGEVVNGTYNLGQVGLIMLGDQTMSFSLFNSTTFEETHKARMPITPTSILKWFGFSEEGVMLTMNDDLESLPTFFFSFLRMFTLMIPKTCSEN